MTKLKATGRSARVRGEIFLVDFQAEARHLRNCCIAVTVLEALGDQDVVGKRVVFGAAVAGSFDVGVGVQPDRSIHGAPAVHVEPGVLARELGSLTDQIKAGDASNLDIIRLRCGPTPCADERTARDRLKKFTSSQSGSFQRRRYWLFLFFLACFVDLLYGATGGSSGLSLATICGC